MISIRTAVNDVLGIANRPPFYDAGLGVYIRQLVGSSTPAFTPASLFASGAPGFLLDATLADLSSLFQDDAGTIPVTAVEDPVGRVLDTSGNGNHFVQATSAARPVLSARVNLLLASATLSTQSVTTAAATYTLVFAGAGSVTLSGTAVGVYTAGTYSVVCTAGSLTLTVLGAVTSADLRVTNDGVGLPAYQAVVTATDYATTGFPIYLRYDGADDFLVSAATVNFSTTAQMSVFAGVRKIGTGSDQIILEHSVNANTQTGSFYFLSNPSTGSRDFAFQVRGTASNFGGYLPPVTPSTFGVTGLLTTSAATAAVAIEARVNGLLVTQTASSNGNSTGNFGNHFTYISRRAGTSLPFNGRIYFPLVVLGRTATATEITNMESFLNTRNGIY